MMAVRTFTALSFAFVTCCATPRVDPPLRMCARSDEARALAHAWDEEMKRLVKRLHVLRRTSRDANVEWVRSYVGTLAEIDQHLRTSSVIDGFKDPRERTCHHLHADRQTVAWNVFAANELRTLLNRWPWFDISTFGAETDKNAWIIVQHADHDPAFQAMMLERLRTRLSSGETSAENFAYLHDRVLVRKGHPQTYGTQGHCDEGEWIAAPMIEREQVIRNRQELGMRPLDDDLAMGQWLCAQYQPTSETP